MDMFVVHERQTLHEGEASSLLAPAFRLSRATREEKSKEREKRAAQDQTGAGLSFLTWGGACLLTTCQMARQILAKSALCVCVTPTWEDFLAVEPLPSSFSRGMIYMRDGERARARARLDCQFLSQKKKIAGARELGFCQLGIAAMTLSRYVPLPGCVHRDSSPCTTGVRRIRRQEEPAKAYMMRITPKQLPLCL